MHLILRSISVACIVVIVVSQLNKDPNAQLREWEKDSAWPTRKPKMWLEVEEKDFKTYGEAVNCYDPTQVGSARPIFIATLKFSHLTWKKKLWPAKLSSGYDALVLATLNEIYVFGSYMQDRQTQVSKMNNSAVAAPQLPEYRVFVVGSYLFAPDRVFDLTEVFLRGNESKPERTYDEVPSEVMSNETKKQVQAECFKNDKIWCVPDLKNPGKIHISNTDGAIAYYEPRLLYFDCPNHEADANLCFYRLVNKKTDEEYFFPRNLSLTKNDDYCGGNWTRTMMFPLDLAEFFKKSDAEDALTTEKYDPIAAKLDKNGYYYEVDGAASLQLSFINWLIAGIIALVFY